MIHNPRFSWSLVSGFCRWLQNVEETACTHLAIQTGHQAAGRVDKLPNHTCQLLRALGFAVNLRCRHGGRVVRRRLRVLLCRLCGVYERNLTGCLENRTGATVEGNGRFDARLLGQPAESLFKGIGAISLMGRAGRLAMSIRNAVALLSKGI